MRYDPKRDGYYPPSAFSGWARVFVIGLAVIALLVIAAWLATVIAAAPVAELMRLV